LNVVRKWLIRKLGGQVGQPEVKEPKPYKNHGSIVLIFMGLAMCGLALYGIFTTAPYSPDRKSDAIMLALGLWIVFCASFIRAIEL